VGAAAPEKKMGLGLGFFLYFFLMLSKLPPPGFELKAAIYRQIIFRASKLVPQVLCLAPNFNQFTW
jgi:hypothetical protein